MSWLLRSSAPQSGRGSRGGAQARSSIQPSTGVEHGLGCRLGRAFWNSCRGRIRSSRSRRSTVLLFFAHGATKARIGIGRERPNRRRDCTAPGRRGRKRRDRSNGVLAFNLALLADAERNAKQHDQARGHLDEAERLMAETGDRYAEAELYRVRGELLRSGDDHTGAERCFPSHRHRTTSKARSSGSCAPR